jgi:hypothetical protein
VTLACSARASVALVATAAVANTAVLAERLITASCSSAKVAEPPRGNSRDFAGQGVANPHLPRAGGTHHEIDLAEKSTIS